MIVKQINILVSAGFLLLSFGCDQEISRTPPDPPPSTSLIFVDSNPQGAQIFIDDKNTDLITPDTVKLFDAKRYQITLRREYYSDTSFYHEAERGKFSEYFLDYLQDPKMLGRFKCFSVPEGVNIILNNEDSGLLTPDTLKYLVPGEHKLIFRKEGYIDILKTEYARSNKTVDVFVIMKDDSG